LQRDQDPRVLLDDAEIDAARAAGCLLELAEDAGPGRRSTASRFLCDREIAEDLAERSTERLEKQVKENADTTPEDPEPDPSGQLKDERHSVREEAKAAQEAARSHNLKLGRALMARRGAKTRREFTLGR